MPSRKSRVGFVKVNFYSRRRTFRDEAVWINNHVHVYVYIYIYIYISVYVCLCVFVYASARVVQCVNPLRARRNATKTK